MAQSAEFPAYRFVPPRSFTRGRKSGQPSVIFIHTTEGSEGREAAEAGAANDQRRTDGTSTHFFVDADSVVQCVYTWDEAHAARTHGNDVGIQIEICGKAGQSATQWADAVSAATVEQAARLCVAIRKAYGTDRFPLCNLTPAQLRAGRHGFAEHRDATLAWPEDGGTHWDPGPNFPWGKLMNRIQELETQTEAGITVGREMAMEGLDGYALPVLKLGDSDRDSDGYNRVVRAQAELTWLAKYDGKLDGEYGPKTAAAVRALGINDGKVIDRDVWAKLYGLSKVK